MKNIKYKLLFAGLLLLTSLYSVADKDNKDIALSYAKIDGMHVLSNGIILGAGGYKSDQLLYVQQDGKTYDYIKGFFGPVDLTQTPNGEIYVTNFNNATVSKVNTDGSVEKFADVLEGPSGITSDLQGNLYVSHYGVGTGDGDTVLKISAQGLVSTYATGGLLNAPIGTTIDENGNLYVANFNDGLVLKITPDGAQTMIAEIQSDVGYAIGHLEYADHKLFLSNPAGGKVYKIRIGKNHIGRPKEVNASKKLTYPNGLTYNGGTNSILVSEIEQTSKLASIKL